MSLQLSVNKNAGNTMSLTAIIRRMKNPPGPDQKKLSFVQTWRNDTIYPSLIKMEAFFELELFFFCTFLPLIAI